MEIEHKVIDLEYNRKMRIDERCWIIQPVICKVAEMLKEDAQQFQILVAI